MTTPNPQQLLDTARTALRAAAHAYDACHRKHGKQDPRTKEAADVLEDRATEFAAAQLINIATARR